MTEKVHHGKFSSLVRAVGPIPCRILRSQELQTVPVQTSHHVYTAALLSLPSADRLKRKDIAQPGSGTGNGRQLHVAALLTTSTAQ